MAFEKRWRRLEVVSMDCEKKKEEKSFSCEYETFSGEENDLVGIEFINLTGKMNSSIVSNPTGGVAVINQWDKVSNKDQVFCQLEGSVLSCETGIREVA